ncbi:hypothetical protein JK162_05850 [Leuconostoc pseudomesenteroides]|jgi:hypothetical protein|uniref:hypothetical protein n=1 Tax=Leuconostoc pseudomesenteroides TaxID=33968 RepID=UPI001B8B7267|nr:hypothetical protein [Leuconostoc pseudomesenteroides]MBS0958023.1 hypothetical protein [Leuconostoc pseudomesenteroides]
MNYIVGFIFVVLVAIIIRQRHQFEKMRRSGRFMSYYAKLNENAKLHAEFTAEITETLLRMQGYDVDRIISGDLSCVIVSEADKQAMALHIEERRHEVEEQDRYFEQVQAEYEMETAE